MQTTTTAPAKALGIICLSSAFWAFSFGVSAPLASLWLHNAGCTDTIIGFNTAFYYAGLALAAVGVPMLMRRWGPSCTIAGMLLSGLTVVLFPFGHTMAWWFGIRLLNGVAGAISLIPMETYVNRDLEPDKRARNFGLYAVALAVGWALGNWVGLEMVSEYPMLAFFAGGMASLLGAVILKVWLPPLPLQLHAEAATVPLDLRDNLLSFGAAWSQGFLEGGMIAFLSLYLIAQGLSEQHVGWLTSVTMIGVIAFQVPVAWLADWFGRQLVLLACIGLVIVGLVAVPLAGTSPLLPAALFVVGACSGAFYPLGLALLGENLPTGQLDRANALYLSMECIGCLMGPALMGIARDWGGETAMFAVGEGAIFLMLGVWLVGRRQEAPVAQDSDGTITTKRAA